MKSIDEMIILYFSAVGNDHFDWRVGDIDFL